MADVYICKIIKKETLTDSIFAITVECPGIAGTSRAGQFVHIKCGEKLLLRRPLSIRGVIGDLITFVFEVRNEGTRELSSLLPGDKLDMLGPLGNGFNLPDGRILVVGGGIGVPPLLFAAESAKGSVTALIGFRDSTRIILNGAFESVCENVYITTDDGSFGIHGPVTKPLVDILEQGAFDTVLTCGPRAMLYSIAKTCERYVVPCQTSLEERMGCGVGACLVCACAAVGDGTERMIRVCKDGPVFDSRELVW